MTRSRRNQILIGGIAVLLLAGILCGIFLPRIARKAEMQQLLQRAAAEDLQYLVLTDPHYKNEELFATKGKEVTLAGEDLQAVRAQLLLLAQDFNYKSKDQNGITGLDLRLHAQCADGSYIQLYFQDGQFYYIGEGVTYYFTADAQAYGVLLATLRAALA